MLKPHDTIMTLQYLHANITNKGLKKNNNEDYLKTTQTPNGYIFVVCDGMGGHAAGEIASKIATQTITHHFETQKYSNIKTEMLQAMIKANKNIIENAKQNQQRNGMGTTATLLLIQNTQAQIAHIGDSRIYLHTDNYLHRLTKDHSIVQQLIDNGKLSEEQAETDKRRNKITKVLGINSIIDPTIAKIPIKPKTNDTFMICSDGLTDMLSEPGITSVLNNKKLTLDQKNTELVKLANKAGGKDNISIILVQITKSPHNKTTFESYSSEKMIFKQKIICKLDK